nr:S41 family peptidase [uncultured Mucilaginibacter sp.]
MKFTSSAGRLLLIAIILLCCSCNKLAIKTEKSDPVTVFDYLWNTLDTKYAMFTYKHVDWQTIYNKYRVKITEGTSDSQLFEICTDMMDELKDGHVSLTSNSKIYSYTGYYRSYDHNFNYDVLKTRYVTDLKTKGILAYQIVNGIGYLYVPSFGHELKSEDINVALEEFAAVDKIIIDVRDNAGGGSVVADLLASKFVGQKTLVKYDAYKRGAGHDDYYPQVAKHLDAGDSRFADKQVAILTNRRCFSSCNDFALYMSLLPHVVIIGDQTGGGGGTPFNLELPNGWLLSYSSSQATSPTGFNIENGIAPDFLVTNSLSDNTNKRDAVFEYAVTYLNNH